MICCENKLYEICLQTAFQAYDIFLDSVTGEIKGLNIEPVLDYEDLYGEKYIVNIAAA